MIRITTLFFLSLLFLSSNAFSDGRFIQEYSTIKETGKITQNTPIVYGNAELRGGTYPLGTIPTGMTGFFDYVTNGNSIRDIQVFGDTIICSWVLADSTDPTGMTSRKAYYTVSYDNGVSWLGAPIAVNSERSAYPDITPYIGLVGRTIVLNGRAYDGSTSRGGVFSEALLGLGSLTQTYAPGMGRDYFAYKVAGTKIGGAYNVPTDDSLIYSAFDYSLGSFGSSMTIAGGSTEIGASSRQYVAASDDGNNVVVMWWFNDPSAIQNAMNYRVSSDGGNTFGAIQKWLLQGQTFNGDSVTPWFGSDLVYKPGTNQFCAAANTLGFSGGAPNFGTREGYKLLFWSPSVNGGTPTVIADRSNFPSLSDTAIFNNLSAIQVGATAVSHPSLAYSDDGSTLYCLFSGVQPDTLDAFNYNDIYICRSTDDGATWTPPVNITNTADWDEMYPSIAKTGNTSTKINVVWQATKGPGCQSFTDLTPTYRVWQVYAKIDPQTGGIINVNNISSQVPEGFSLKQNYPNPFNPSTSIRFELPKANRVTLKVYDMSGKEVAILVKNEQVSAGLNEVVFNGSALASGVYFYTLQAGDFKETKKMVLVK